MTSSNNYFILATLALTLFVWHCQADFIQDVCSKSNDTDADFCIRVLRSDLRSNGADLRVLGEIIIDKSIEAVRVASMVAKSVETPENKNIIETCIETLNYAIDDLYKCKTSLKSANGPEMEETLKLQASGALTDAGTCEDEFEDTQTQPPELQQASKYAQDLISVLLIISYN